jgi:hypothetical protein
MTVAGFGLLLVLCGFLLVWIAYRGVDWSQNPDGGSVIESLFDAVSSLG